ncbi:MAG TPA: ABC transporter ATP-binding protein [Longimicrobiaceae bacterium]|nr:ABC transporter ATP-binding protein [Longimicrobiaceae bacterium]
MSHEYAYERRGTLLEVQDVSFARGGVPILKDVNARIDDLVRPGMSQGQIVGLLGPSGVGKTTLFRILAGLLKPDTGSVKVGAQGLPTSPGMVGVVAQNYVLLDHRSVGQNLEIAARQGRLTPADAKARIDDYLSRFELAPHRDKFPQQLSGGQRQRVAIAQQLLCSDHYLVMDEPFSGLDVVAQERVQKLLVEVANTHEENTIILVTHDVSAAVAVCDTIWLMGRDRTPENEPVPGARVMEVLDLIDMDLCWHAEIQKQPGYAELVRRIKDRFHTL